LFDFFPLVGRQLQTGAAIIAQRFFEELFVFPGELWMRIGKSFNGLVNVFAIVHANCPLLERLHGVLGSSAHRGILVRFLDDRGPVGRETCLISDIIQRDHRALESDLAQVLSTNLIQRGVRLRDRIFH
jgi:hypothetical protein